MELWFSSVHMENNWTCNYPLKNTHTYIVFHIVAVVLRMGHNVLEVHPQCIRTVANPVEVLPDAMQTHNSLDLSWFHELLQPIADAMSRREDPSLRDDSAATKVTTTTHQTDHVGHFVALRLTASHDFWISNRAWLVANCHGSQRNFNLREFMIRSVENN